MLRPKMLPAAALMFAVTIASVHAQTQNSAPRSVAPAPTTISPEGIAMHVAMPLMTAYALPKPAATESTGSTVRAAAPDQPEMATGLDLTGPGMRFEANQTPE